MPFDSFLQPLFLCLGESVAGDPCQYLLSHAAQSEKLEISFQTAQHRSGDFENALRGLMALQLAGAILLDRPQLPTGRNQSESDWMKSLVNETPPGLASDFLTAVRRDGDCYTGFDALPTATCSLMADGVVNQSNESEHHIVLIGNRHQVASWCVIEPAWKSLGIWLSNEEDGSSLVDSRPEVVSEQDAGASRDRAKNDRLTPDETAASMEAGTQGSESDVPLQFHLDDFNQSDRQMAGIVLLLEPNDSAQTVSKILQACRDRMTSGIDEIPVAVVPVNSPGMTRHLLADDRSVGEHSELNEILSQHASVFRPIDRHELLLQIAIANFAFLTGCRPEVPPLRELLDEYLQW